MGLFAPRYYKDFKCIADKCRHSCCTGWEIDIDSDTLARYEGGVGGYREKIKQSIEYADTPHFRLSENERCPHLNECGLCNIITELGEGWLCDICREHPRFYNDTPHGREVGVGMACEEACRLILASDDYKERVEIGEHRAELSDFEIDTVAEREKIYSILSDASIPYEKRLLALWERYGASPRILSDGEWRDVICSLEYLQCKSKGLFSVYSSEEYTPSEYEVLLERFLAYLIFRHATPAKTEERFRSALGFAFFTERLFASILKAQKNIDMETILEYARVISEELEYSLENTDTVMLEFEFI